MMNPLEHPNPPILIVLSLPSPKIMTLLKRMEKLGKQRKKHVQKPKLLLRLLLELRMWIVAH